MTIVMPLLVIHQLVAPFLLVAPLHGLAEVISAASSSALLEPLAGVDHAPLFVLSLLPYLAFLRWAGRSGRFPPLALRGFQFTLVFVAVTIVAAVVAELPPVPCCSASSRVNWILSSGIFLLLIPWSAG